MSYVQVRQKLGRRGIQSVTRKLDSRETSAADYPGPALDVYVEYDHRIDRRPTARAVLVRVSMPMLPTAFESLVELFGPPDAGADDLSDGLLEGIAVWVNEPCGVVLTAYRPRDSWWAAEGRTTLQLETLDLARKPDSPASSSLGAILERKHGPPAISDLPSPVMEPDADLVEANDEPASMAVVPTPESVVAPDADLPLTAYVPSPVMEIDTGSDEANDEPASMAVVPTPESVVSAPESVVAPSPRQESLEDRTSTTAVAPAEPLTIATWRSQISAGSDRKDAPKSNAPTGPLTIATWHPQVRDDVAPAPPADKPAERIAFVPPVYPRTARWLGIKGHVKLAILVQSNGGIATTPRIVAENPAGRGFAESALDAVRTWRFVPAVREGRPVESTLTIDVEFEPPDEQALN